MITATSCLTCHKLHGKGLDVGPDLTGVGRADMDALLSNVLAPNQIIGHGYELVEVDTKDGRTVTGRMTENSDVQVKLVQTAGIENVVAKEDVKALRVTDKSVMPEGFEHLPDADFRNMIWYLLNPPEDNRPMTDALRKELIITTTTCGLMQYHRYCKLFVRLFFNRS